MNKTTGRVCACVLSALALTAEARVSVEAIPGGWTLMRDGKPYSIKGAGGGGPKDMLAALGGNSFRTWGSDKAKQELDDAQKNGLSVTLGHWFGWSDHGFNYGDPTALANQKEAVRKMVLENKDHPALLMWALGNEMEQHAGSHGVEMWKHIEDVAKMVKALDPDHPVMTVVAEVWDTKVADINQYCPSVDIIGINSYGGAPSVVERWIKAGGKKPVVITEFGPPGTWEIKANAFGCPPEMTSTEKGQWYADVYKKLATEKICLGSYAFTWGWKVEATPTWYGMLLPDNTKLASTEALQECWGTAPVKNLVPTIGKIVVSADDVGAGVVITAETSAQDADGDTLKWKWALLQESGNYGVIGTGDPMPAGFPDAIVEGQGTSKVKVVAPGGGKYRLYAYVFDGQGNGAYANVPIQSKGAAPKTKLAQMKLPFAVYGDGVPETYYASGYMGTTSAIKVDLANRDTAHTGETSMACSISDHGGWGGVLWQNPANDWGEKAGGFDLSGATMLEFWARGKDGGEKVSFQCGGVAMDKPTGDTFKGELKELVLKNEWVRYRIPLDGQDLTRVKTPFGWVVGGQGRPVAFYVDDIRFTAD